MSSTEIAHKQYFATSLVPEKTALLVNDPRDHESLTKALRRALRDAPLVREIAAAQRCLGARSRISSRTIRPPICWRRSSDPVPGTAPPDNLASMSIALSSTDRVADTVAAAMAFPMDAVVRRYAEDHNLPLKVAREHETELKRYLTLCALSENGSYGMLGAIDVLWHTFILFTREYERFVTPSLADSFTMPRTSLPKIALRSRQRTKERSAIRSGVWRGGTRSDMAAVGSEDVRHATVAAVDRTAELRWTRVEFSAAPNTLSRQDFARAVRGARKTQDPAQQAH